MFFKQSWNTFGAIDKNIWKHDELITSRVHYMWLYRIDGQLLMNNGTSTRDDRGVERSAKPFARPPQLDINIRQDLSRSGDRSMTRRQRAMAMLADDVRNNRNPLLLNAWNYGASQKSQFVSVIILRYSFIKSTRKLDWIAFQDKAISFYFCWNPYTTRAGTFSI